MEICNGPIWNYTPSQVSTNQKFVNQKMEEEERLNAIDDVETVSRIVFCFLQICLMIFVKHYHSQYWDTVL